ncbi:MAG: glycosyl hydrolase family 28 protein [Opitutaceae bacterium]
MSILVVVAFGLVPVSRMANAQPAAAAPRVFDVTQHGATGKRAESATKAIQAAIDACTAAGGGVVYVPPGEYSIGAIRLKDNVELRVEAGATLFLSQDRAEFTGGQRAMINADGAKNIALTGRGTLDGLAQYVFADMRGPDPEIAESRAAAQAVGIPLQRYYRTGMQAYMLILSGSTDVRLEGITLINSPLWNVRLNECDRVFIRGVHIYSDLEKGVNSDGIDLVSSRNVLISDCIIVTADDAIALKTQGRGNAPAKPVENITVTNCILTSSSTPLNIGTETLADIRHVIFTNCVIRDSNKGFGINVQDGDTVSDVIVRNITMDSRRRHWNWWGDAEAFKLVLKKRTPESKLGAIKNIMIDNFICHVRGTSTLTGHAERPLENIAISNVQLFMEPENTPDKRATDAIRIEGVNGLTLRNVAVTWAEEQIEPKWRSALVLKDVTRLDLDTFTARQGLKAGTTPAIVLENVTDGVLRNLRAAVGSGTFLEFRGAKTADLTVHTSDFKKATRPVVFSDGAESSQVTLR